MSPLRYVSAPRPPVSRQQLPIFPLAGNRLAINIGEGALAVAIFVLPLAGVCAEVGKPRGALAGPLALAVRLAGVRHAAGLSRFGVVSKR